MTREYIERAEQFGFELSEDVVLLAIQQQPVADVKPVVRGKWEIKKDLRRGTAICNQCNYAYSMGTPFHEYPPKYCPNCGAKKDGGQGNERAYPSF